MGDMISAMADFISLFHKFPCSVFLCLRYSLVVACFLPLINLLSYFQPCSLLGLGEEILREKMVNASLNEYPICSSWIFNFLDTDSVILMQWTFSEFCLNGSACFEDLIIEH